MTIRSLLVHQGASPSLGRAPKSQKEKRSGRRVGKDGNVGRKDDETFPDPRV